jgi:hypothetical protein
MMWIRPDLDPDPDPQHWLLVLLEAFGEWEVFLSPL